MPYSTADIEAAIARGNGQSLANIRAGTLNASSASDLGPSRILQPKGKAPYVSGYGHAFAHVRTFAEGATDPNIKASSAISKAQKSMWQDRRTAIEAAKEMMDSRQAQPGIQKFAGGAAPSQNPWPKHIPLDGIYYGYEAGKNELRLVEEGSINFWITGSLLFIYSCYPDAFVAGVKGLRSDHELEGLSGLFG